MSPCRVEVDYTRCTGCRACQMTCALAHVREIRMSASAIRILSSSDEGINVPLVCVGCSERACIAACPVGAVREEEGLGMPIVDSELCTGCRACVSACPYEGMSFDVHAARAVKCDLCGGAPLCVKVCNAAENMPGALTLIGAPGGLRSLEQAAERADIAREWRARKR